MSMMTTVAHLGVFSRPMNHHVFGRHANWQSTSGTQHRIDE